MHHGRATRKRVWTTAEGNLSWQVYCMMHTNNGFKTNVY